MDISKRNSALDIVRIVALLSVVCIHFFLNTGYYNEPMLGKEMLVLTVLRTAFAPCVPLFMMLSGYLLNNKRLSAKYYLGIVKILGVYVLASIACIIYKAVEHGERYTLGKAILGILNFTGANYAWYIEMYIGLFLLIPFLNLAYRGLKSRREKLALVVTMIVLTILPTVLNIHNFTVDGWFRTPYISTEYHPLVADWWTGLYPITYYYLGAYLKEYPLKINKWLTVLLFALSVVVFGLFNYYRSWGGFYSWGAYQDWFGFTTFIEALLLFSLLSVRDTSRFPKGLKKLLADISDLCLGAYLVSYIFDSYFYKILNGEISSITQRAWYFVPTVAAVFTASLILSWVINIIYKLLYKAVFIVICRIGDKCLLAKSVSAGEGTNKNETSE